MKNMIFDTSAEMTDIYDLLLRLGVTANYIGFFHTAFAVHLAIQEPERLLLVTYTLRWRGNTRPTGAALSATSG